MRGELTWDEQHPTDFLAFDHEAAKRLREKVEAHSGGDSVSEPDQAAYNDVTVEMNDRSLRQAVVEWMDRALDAEDKAATLTAELEQARRDIGRFIAERDQEWDRRKSAEQERDQARAENEQTNKARRQYVLFVGALRDALKPTWASNPFVSDQEIIDVVADLATLPAELEQARRERDGERERRADAVHERDRARRDLDQARRDIDHWQGVARQSQRERNSAYTARDKAIGERDGARTQLEQARASDRQLREGLRKIYSRAWISNATKAELGLLAQAALDTVTVPDQTEPLDA